MEKSLESLCEAYFKKFNNAKTVKTNTDALEGKQKEYRSI